MVTNVQWLLYNKKVLDIVKTYTKAKSEINLFTHFEFTQPNLIGSMNYI